MRTTGLLIILFLLISFSGFSQNLVAKYAITEKKEIDLDGKQKTFFIELTGHLYAKNGRYIYWESPDYLKKYPTAEINIETAKGATTISLSKDTLQFLRYIDFNNLILKNKSSNTELDLNDAPIDEWIIEKDYTLNWEYSDQTKNINGLKCQLAILKNQWKVWFCADIPSKLGVLNVIGLPGLVVEADNIPLDTHYKLLSYDNQTEVPDNVFELKQLKHTIKRGILKTIRTKEKSKLEKEQDIIKSNN
jgi:GLPGLI family protein